MEDGAIEHCINVNSERRRNMATIEETFIRLGQSDFRRKFHLSQQDRKYISEKGLDTIREHALKVGYINQGHHCGCSESHTVRDWILSFGLEKEDENFKQWSVYQFRFGTMFRDLERVLMDEEFIKFITVFIGLVYGFYDTSKEFLPQLINNCEKASGMVLSKIIRNRGPFYER